MDAWDHDDCQRLSSFFRCCSFQTHWGRVDAYIFMVAIKGYNFDTLIWSMSQGWLLINTSCSDPYRHGAAPCKGGCWVLVFGRSEGPLPAHCHRGLLGVVCFLIRSCFPLSFRWLVSQVIRRVCVCVWVYVRLFLLLLMKWYAALLRVWEKNICIIWTQICFFVCHYENVCAHLSLKVCNLVKLLILSFELQLSVYSKEITNFLKEGFKT